MTLLPTLLRCLANAWLQVASASTVLSSSLDMGSCCLWLCAQEHRELGATLAGRGSGSRLHLQAFRPFLFTWVFSDWRRPLLRSRPKRWPCEFRRLLGRLLFFPGLLCCMMQTTRVQVVSKLSDAGRRGLVARAARSLRIGSLLLSRRTRCWRWGHQRHVRRGAFFDHEAERKAEYKSRSTNIITHQNHLVSWSSPLSIGKTKALQRAASCLRPLEAARGFPATPKWELHVHGIPWGVNAAAVWIRLAINKKPTIWLLEQRFWFNIPKSVGKEHVQYEPEATMNTITKRQFNSRGSNYVNPFKLPAMTCTLCTMTCWAWSLCAAAAGVPKHRIENNQDFKISSSEPQVAKNEEQLHSLSAPLLNCWSRARAARGALRLSCGAVCQNLSRMCFSPAGTHEALEFSDSDGSSIAPSADRSGRGGRRYQESSLSQTAGNGRLRAHQCIRGSRYHGYKQHATGLAGSTKKDDLIQRLVHCIAKPAQCFCGWSLLVPGARPGVLARLHSHQNLQTGSWRYGDHQSIPLRWKWA